MFDKVTTLPEHLMLPSRWARTKHWIGNSLNFYRLHMLIFIFMPLILSAVFYGISTAYQISYIDCLVNCVSAMTVTGLATVNLTTLSTMQQVLLFIQSLVGSMTFVSIIMILVRLYFFRQEFKHVILEAKRKQEEAAREKGEKKFNLTRTISRAVPVSTIKRRLSMMGPRDKFAAESEPHSAPDDDHSAPSSVEMKPVRSIDHARPRAEARSESPNPAASGTRTPKEKEKEEGKHTPKKKKNKVKINKDMIKRVEGGGMGMVNPMGWYDYSPSHTPGRMSFVGMRPAGANVPDVITTPTTAETRDGSRKGGDDSGHAGATATDTTATTEAGTGTGTPSRGERGDQRGQAPNADRLAEGIARAKALDESALDTDSDSDEEDTTQQQQIAQPTAERISASQVPPAILQQNSQDGILGTPSRMYTTSPPAMSDLDEKNSPAGVGGAVKTPYAGRAADDEAFPRAKTIAFEDERDGLDHDHHPATAFPALGPSTSRYQDGFQSRGFTSAREGGFFPRTATTRSGAIPRTATTGNFPRTYTMASRRPETKYNHFGGFPSPLKLIAQLAKKAFPGQHRSLTQTLTMPRTNTIGRKGTIVSETETGVEKEVPYISFAAVVGRNSRFEGLTSDQMDELGGVEYRALKVLMWIVIGYFVCVQLGAFVILAPYVAAGGRYDYVFEAQPQRVQIPWFALFQSVSAFSNLGMSLVDQSMVPFQTAYLMTALIAFLIFAGNTAYPVFLRMTVWTVYKLVPKRSRTKETLKFLLDHPRRCFVYLFPSTQTYVLACVMISLYMIDFVCFLVLDIGNPVIQDIPIGIRISNAFGQSAAVRAAGFAFVPLAAVAPAVKILYVVMMYVSVYPIALSVRSTNVYEEKSLGLFEEEMEDDLTYGEKGASAVAKYVGWHARRQLAFDIWWLGFALWLVCIIERSQLNNVENATWFNIFNIIFELVSAYGTVGLSLGVPYDNYSFCGSWSTLSKLVVCAVMIRGRHRGLPVAIDRAVMLPRDFSAEEEREFEETRSRRASRRGSSFYESSMLDPVSGTSGLYPVPSRTYSRTGTGASFASPRRASFMDPSSAPVSAGAGASSGNPMGANNSPPSAAARTASGDAVLEGHAAYMQHRQQQTGGGIISPIIGSPLNPMHIRTQSSSAGVGAEGGNGSLNGSPAQLSFALPRTSTMGSRQSAQSGHGYGYGMGASTGMGTGALSPVKESALSRAPTLSEKRE